MNPFMKSKSTVRIAAWLILLSAQSLYANTLTIGKGTGVVWQGAPFSKTLTVNYPGAQFENNTIILTRGGVASISNSTTDCLSSSALSTLNGYQIYPIAQGIGLIPLATLNVEITNISAGLTGTIGFEGTQGTMGSYGSAIIPTNRDWCLSFADHGSAFPFTVRGGSQQKATITGLWAIVADGTQQTGTYTLPPMYAGTFNDSSNNSESILTYTFLRVTSIACSIATTTNVNFGTAARNTTLSAELANVTAPLTVMCNQDAPDTIDTNINVQFSGKLFNSNASRLALDQGGGYITGEISNGVTGSGTCDASTGVNFNSTDINVGVLGANELNQTYNNQIIWRLCSGGNTLPTGPVTASANVAVTYN